MENPCKKTNITIGMISNKILIFCLFVFFTCFVVQSSAGCIDDDCRRYYHQTSTVVDIFSGNPGSVLANAMLSHGEYSDADRLASDIVKASDKADAKTDAKTDPNK